VYKILDLTHHHYTAKQPARYLEQWKENLQSDQRISLADFSENYSFILQDAIRGFYWANVQTVLHPFIVHFNDRQLQALFFCVISDCLQQNTSSLHSFQRILVYLHINFPNQKKVIYFSDGNAARYKNRKKLLTSAMNKILVSLC
jgi:hypothetical protein